MFSGRVLVLFFSVIVFFASCTRLVKKEGCQPDLAGKFDAIIVQSSLKGWELYSWPDQESCSGWFYAILPGTNNIKSYQAVTSDTVLLRAAGTTQLKALLRKFPAGEHILWIGENWLQNSWTPGNISYGNLKLAPVAVQNELVNICTQTGLSLTIAP
jgi:hypothetical protein